MKADQLIKNLIKQKESEQLEFVEALSKEHVANTICGFLNGKGGQILIGVKENGTIAGISNPTKYKEELRKYFSDTLLPEAPITISIEDVDNKKIANIEVWEGAKKPYISNGSIYYRKKDKTVRASSKEISELIHSRQLSETHWERQIVLGVELKDLDTLEIKNTIKHLTDFGGAKKKSGDVLNFLTHYGLFQNGYFTNSAVVLFAKEPSRFLPQTRFRISILKDEKTGNRFVNDKLLEGNLFKNFRDIEQYLQSNLEHQRIFKSGKWQRTDEYIYPTEALREGIINALVHRDYENISGGASLIIYNDRLEITNTGKLPDNMTVADLKVSHISSPPNPDIAQICFLKGYIEKIGRGTIKIIEELKKAKLKEPVWKTSGGAVKLTFYNNLKQNDKGVTEGVNRGITEGISKAVMAKIEDIVEGVTEGVTEGVKSKIKDTILAIYKHEGINTNEIADAIGVPVKSLERHIKLLKDAKIIEFKGAPRTGGYHIAKRTITSKK